MKEREFKQLATKQRKGLKIGESAVTIHTLEGNRGYYLTVIDEFSAQLMAVTEQELYLFHKHLKKKYDGEKIRNAKED